MYQINVKYEILIKVSFLFISTLDVKKEKKQLKIKSNWNVLSIKKKIRENDQDKRFGTY